MYLKVLCVVLLLIIIYMIYVYFKKHNALLSGLWQLDSAFIKKKGGEQIFMEILQSYNLEKNVNVNIYNSEKGQYELIEGTMWFIPTSLPCSDIDTYCVTSK